jgi:potassium-transporting ATPase ATP-binding subunit
MMDATTPIPQGTARRTARGGSALGDPAILRRAALDAVGKLDPRRLARNPVIFVTEVVSILVTILAVRAVALGQPWTFQAGIALWLWLTVLFATFAEGPSRRAAAAPRPTA